MQGLLNLFPAQASNPVNIQTYLALWAGLARAPAPAHHLASCNAGAGGDSSKDSSNGSSKDRALARRPVRASLCAPLLASMRVPFYLAHLYLGAGVWCQHCVPCQHKVHIPTHLYLGAASPDASMPRIAFFIYSFSAFFFIHFFLIQRRPTRACRASRRSVASPSRCLLWCQHCLLYQYKRTNTDAPPSTTVQILTHLHLQ